MAGKAKGNYRNVLKRLERAYGRPAWRRWGNAVSVLVETILSQNTSRANYTAGYRQLRRRFPKWDQVAAAPVEQVERCIRVCGLSRLKAPRIGAILRQIKEDRGRIDLEFLKGMTPEAAGEYLRRFDGVGPKTAWCVLLFSLMMPVFPVDTHIHRIARRLKWIGPRVSPEQTQDLLGPKIPPADRYAMHVLLIEHGRRTCRARNPKCEWCCLADVCPSAK